MRNAPHTVAYAVQSAQEDGGLHFTGKKIDCTSAVAKAVHGMQVYRACQMGYWRASKRWCKQLPSETVNRALAVFANNEAGLRPSDVYAGPSGAIAQLQQLAAWFQVHFFFRSSSIGLGSENMRLALPCSFSHNLESIDAYRPPYPLPSCAEVRLLQQGLRNWDFERAVMWSCFHDCCMSCRGRLFAQLSCHSHQVIACTP